MSYLRNAWYVAAWADSIGDTLLPRTIIGEPVVVFRDAMGVAKAIGDTCPHRFAPLHRGSRCSDGTVACPYHGLRFNGAGQCVHNPHGDGKIPQAAKVQSYEVVEKYNLVWVWMGDSAKADASVIPNFSFVSDGSLATVKGEVLGNGHYELYSDNILDLGHAEFLHAGGLGSPAFTKNQREIYQDGAQVWSNIASLNDYLPPLPGLMKELEGERKDWWVDVRWDPPASMELTMYVSEIGGTRASARWIDRALHIMTPEAPNKTRYFWAFSRNYRVEDEALSEQIRQGLAIAFDVEDKPMIEAQELAMKGRGFWELGPVLLNGDAGGVRARRVLAELITRQERSQVGEAAQRGTTQRGA